jgi:hypothetical protein
MRGRLNLFQSTMLRWRSFHPYNAVHVAELPGPLDAAGLAAAVADHLAALGVTGLVLDARRRAFEFRGGRVAYDVPVLAGGSAPLAVIEREMERQLNEGFPETGAFEPFRFFVVDAGATFHLGVAYDHFLAGGDSIVVLLKGIAVRYAGGATGLPPPALYPRTYEWLFAKNLVTAHIGQYYLPSMLLRMRRAFRPRYRFGEGWSNAFTSVEFPPDCYRAIVAAAKRWGVTFNDLLLALVFVALSPEVPERHGQKRRRELAIASVVNIRGELAGSPDATFGQFLSSQIVMHPAEPGTALETIARAVNAQTQRVKRRKLYLMTLYMLSWGALAWPFMTPAQRKHVYAKNYPVWAGLSTLNVDALWRNAAGETPVLHYLRAVSTGPFCPLVVAPASVGDCLHVGLSYRTAAFCSDDAARMSAALLAAARGLLPAAAPVERARELAA